MNSGQDWVDSTSDNKFFLIIMQCFPQKKNKGG